MVERILRLALTGGLIAVWSANAWAEDTAIKGDHPVGKHALLVGCTKYQLPGVLELWGPANDVPMWSKVLTEDFGFDEANIRKLVDWPDDPRARPTRENIVREFEGLIAAVGPRDQVVIVLSGHGAQVPIPEGKEDRSNPEPDGMDEVFLPADVKAWTPEGVENAIKDDEIGRWLDRLREKGANTWIIFDCCHSGTMTRGGGQEGERSRTVRPTNLGIPERVIADAARGAKAARGERPTDAGVVRPARTSGRLGSLVAFYAAQPFEESPELPRPEDAPQVRENYYGLFSYTLTMALAQRRSPLTYGELAQLVASRYRADRRSRPPTAFVEGDLDREVLGLGVWPKRSDILLSQVAGATPKLMVSAGELMGLGIDGILAIHPPAGDARAPDEVLGYTKVVGVDPFSARVEPIAFEQKPAVPSEVLPDRARCEVVARSFGDLRVKLSVIASDQRDRDAVRAALRVLPEQVGAQVVEVDDSSRAEWWLQVHRGQVLLRHGPGRKPGDDEPNKDDSEPEAQFYERYPLRDADRLSAGLSRDCQKIFKWQNIWRIAGSMGQDPSIERGPGLRLEVRTLKGPDDRDGKPLVAKPIMKPGHWIEVQLFNDGRFDLWVTLLNLDARFGIQEIPIGSIKAGKSTRAERFEVTDDAFGIEGLVAFGVPIESSKDQPNFRFLEQQPLGKPQVIELLRSAAPKTPFGQLMANAAFGSQTRGPLRSQVAAEPQIVSAAWVTVPLESAKTTRPGD